MTTYRRLAFPVLICATLAACSTAPARPDQVTLTRDRLTVSMTDGSTCRGPAPPMGADAGWSGQLQDCPWSLPYEVALQPGTNPLRLVLVEVFGAIGLEGVLQPVATVTFPNPRGRTRVFRTP